MTFDYKIIPVQNETIGSPKKVKGFSERRKTVSRKLKRDRRRHKADRRSGVREGVIVDLSFQNSRRRGNDRRRTQISRYV
jgi:hypothetical protein